MKFLKLEKIMNRNRLETCCKLIGVCDIKTVKQYQWRLDQLDRIRKGLLEEMNKELKLTGSQASILRGQLNGTG